MQAMLQMESVRDTEFEPEVLACLPATPWTISQAEISMRQDLRDDRWAPLRSVRMHMVYHL
jgi:DIS3-like exonuclease 2